MSKRFGATTALSDVQLTVHESASHALIGRNGAGKSTLVSLLTGLQIPDSGEIRFDGEKAPDVRDREAWRQRVACVYQRPSIIRQLTVAENLFLNRQHRFGRTLIAWNRLRAEARELLAQWELDVDVDAHAKDLTIEQCQLVEIARALSYGARFIILDEPTARLDNDEIARLFARMRTLQATGVTFLFISHHLHEVYEVCDDVTVLRDATWISTSRVSETPRATLVQAMTGDATTLTEGVTTPRVGSEVPARLMLSGLSGAGFRDMSFVVRRGEVVGLAGSSASGKDEVAEVLSGLCRPSAGTYTLDGAAVRPGSVRDALAAGIGCVPKDRHHEGLVECLSVAENSAMTVLGELGPAGLVPPPVLERVAAASVRDLDIHTSGTQAAVSTLSGGNQQKVVMARALATKPRLLILINPTAGVDVRSKEALLAVVDRLRSDGTSVLIVSDDLDDLRRCDRVLVMRHGCLVDELPAGWRDHALVASIEGVSGD
ncbi:sugar ABC transporter ATP-binding protein [Streptomyces tubercidicus]